MSYEVFFLDDLKEDGPFVLEANHFAKHGNKVCACREHCGLDDCCEKDDTTRRIRRLNTGAARERNWTLESWIEQTDPDPS